MIEKSLYINQFLEGLHTTELSVNIVA